MHKNILIIRSSIEIGGPGRQTIATIRELKKRKYNVILLTGKCELDDEIKNLDIKMSIFPELAVNNRKFFKLPQLILKIRKILIQNNITYVYGLNSFSTLMSYFAYVGIRRKIYFLNTLVGSGKNYFHKRMPFIHTVCSDAQKQQLIENGFPKNKLIVNYPSTLDLETYFPDKITANLVRKELDIPENAIIVGSAMMNTKGSSSIWKIMNKLMDEYDNLYFVWMGNSSKYKYNYEKIDKNKKNRVRLLGVKNDISEIMMSIDIFSHLLDATEYETFGMVITEAMAMEKPVVASSIGGINNIIENESNGYLVCSDKEYYEKIKILIDDEKRREIMGKRSRELCIKKFSVQIHVDKIEKIYKALSI